MYAVLLRKYLRLWTISRTVDSLNAFARLESVTKEMQSCIDQSRISRTDKDCASNVSARVLEIRYGVYIYLAGGGMQLDMNMQYGEFRLKYLGLPFDILCTENRGKFWTVFQLSKCSLLISEL